MQGSMNQPNKIITHTSASGKHNTAQDISQWHFDRWNGYAKSRRKEAPYAGYHVVIEWDGKVVQTRDFDEEGIHCRGQNLSSIGVCFIGHGDHHLPSQEQEEAWVNWYEEHGQGLPVYPHRKYSTKTCHGKLLSDDYFARLVDRQRKLDMIERLNQLISQLRSLLLQRRMR